MNFDEAFENLLGVEKGFQDNPNDRGNWTGGKIGVGILKGTKYGISAARYPMEDIANLTTERAKFLARRDFWGPAGCDALPDELRYDMFETAFHSGHPQAIKFLQRAVGVDVDGVLGSHTLQAALSMNPTRVFARFEGWRLDFMNDNPEQWTNFGRGWAQRIADRLKAA